MLPTLLWLALAASLGATNALRLGKPAPSSGLSSSGTQRFPEDLLAHPAFKIKFDDMKHVSNETATKLIAESQRASAEVAAWQSGGDEAAEARSAVDGTQHMLIRTSPRHAHLCTLTMPAVSNAKPGEMPSNGLSPSGLLVERHRVITSGLSLLAPLRGTCLYHTLDWFTYSLCFGEAVRQFKAIEGTVGPGKVPAQDPSNDAYVIGRWHEDLDLVNGRPWYEATGQQASGGFDQEAVQKRLSALGIFSDGDEGVKATELSTANPRAKAITDLLDSQDDENGTELMQIIRFSSSGIEQRYLSQVWSDGTRCDINNEPRNVEVQYHCNPGLTSSRIAMVKETTTCSYVMIIETGLTCKEPELKVGREEKGRAGKSNVGEWTCSRIVDGDVGQKSNIAESSGSDKSPSSTKDTRAESWDNAAERLASPSASTPKTDSSFEADANLHTSASSPWSASPENPALSSDQYFALDWDEDGNAFVEEIGSWASELMQQQDEMAAREQQQQQQGQQAQKTGGARLREILEQAKVTAQEIRAREGRQAQESDPFEKLIGQLMDESGSRRGSRDEGIPQEDEYSSDTADGNAGSENEDAGTPVERDDLKASLARAIHSELNRLRGKLQHQPNGPQSGAGSPPGSRKEQETVERHDGRSRDANSQEASDSTAREFAELNAEARKQAWRPDPFDGQQRSRSDGASDGDDQGEEKTDSGGTRGRRDDRKTEL
ncbi:unnamed protein product [Jaminaea pallidilutea]